MLFEMYEEAYEIQAEEADADEDTDAKMRRVAEVARGYAAAEAMRVAEVEYGRVRVKLTLAEREILKLKREVNSLSETLHVHLARPWAFAAPYEVAEEPVGYAGAGARAARSCETCISSKTRCDQGKPCGLCTKRGCECIYTAPKKRGPKGRALREFEESLDA